MFKKRNTKKRNLIWNLITMITKTCLKTLSLLKVLKNKLLKQIKKKNN